jgi:hypothetical protein
VDWWLSGAGMAGWTIGSASGHGAYFGGNGNVSKLHFKTCTVKSLNFRLLMGKDYGMQIIP